MLAVISLAAALVLPNPIMHQGQKLYPYYCTKTWVCDFVPEEVYLKYCKKRPCETVR